MKPILKFEEFNVCTQIKKYKIFTAIYMDFELINQNSSNLKMLT